MKTSSMLLLIPLLAACAEGIAAPDAQGRASPGYQASRTYCTQCHALPHADQHPPAEWPAVVARMQSYMEARHRPAPSAAERDAIIRYLQRN